MQPDLFSAPYAISAVQEAEDCSRQGAVKAQEHVARQCLRLLTLYQRVGPLSDRDAAERLNLDRTTVIPRRHELMQRGLVESYGKAAGTKGLPNTRWGTRR